MSSIDIQAIIAEYERAQKLYPLWPTDAVHAAAIVAEEAGELVQATLDFQYRDLNHREGNEIERMRKEAIQTAAMAIRFLTNLHRENGFWG